MKVLVLAEREKALAELCSGARNLGARVEMIAVGEAQKSVPGADKIWFIPTRDGAMPEDYKDTIAALIQNQKPDLVLVEPTRRYKLIAGQLAAMLGCSVIPDIIELAKDGEARHLVYGGAAIRREKSVSPVSIVMVGAGVLNAEEKEPGKGEIEELSFIEPAVKVKLLGRETKEKSNVDLSSAKKVVGVGRGIGKEEDLGMIRELAEAIGGEVGCTRPIAEAEHWLPREAYIGVSGLMLSPEVYIALGISGQVQHTVGINRAKIIIAVNKDKNAPIFKQADYGIVGDIYKVVPALIGALK
ncbi:MAG: electron transfer flavoprotein subunit alpha/FixB family protein [Smithellaceae bacterium]